MNFERLYQYRFRDVEQARRQVVWDEIAPFIYELMGSPARILDPAAGRGEFVTAAPASERWVVDAVSYTTAEHDLDVRVMIGDIMDVDLPTDYFDGIFVSNFLEHLESPSAIAGFLRKMHACLSRGGSIAIMGPNFKYCSREYFDCADHIVPLTQVSVEEHLYAAGFEANIVIPRFLPFSFRSALPASAALTRAYLHCRPLWVLLGKQFLVVGRRP